MTPAVSVLLPTHNNAAYLREAVDSVLAQTFTDFELIVVDDGSTDDTPELLRELARQDPRLRVLRSTAAQGIETALNWAAAESRAEFLARMDADDRCRPERLACQVTRLSAWPEVAALGCQVNMFGDIVKRLDYPLDAAETRAYSLFACPLKHPAVMMRRSAFERAGRYQHDTPCSEDHALWVRMLAFGEIANAPEMLLEYRRHPLSITATRLAQMQASNREVLTRMLADFGLRPTPEQMRVHLTLQDSLYHLSAVTAEERAEAEAWAAELLGVNERRGRVDRVQLERQLRLRLGGLVVQEEVALA